jgi:hypothetical protein
VFRDPEPETVPRECEIGLSIRCERRRPICVLTAEVVIRPLHGDPDEPSSADPTFLPCFHDEGYYPGTSFEGFQITGWYDGRHFYDSGFSFQPHVPIHTDRAQAIARELHTIEQALKSGAASGEQRGLGRHSYPELVVRIAEIIGARFAQHRLDPDPHCAFTVTDLPGLAAAFEQHTPRDTTTEPMPF